jgi:hypothetical protein
MDVKINELRLVETTMQTSFSNPDADTRALTGDFFSRFGPVSFDASSGAAAKQNPADSRRVSLFYITIFLFGGATFSSFICEAEIRSIPLDRA